ncbi:MAG TPA: sugar ABC transporter substrate-binding protein [Treponema sp.]|nr:sugar ABC transporter substrate-binding protein [Treponema sp.]
MGKKIVLLALALIVAAGMVFARGGGQQSAGAGKGLIGVVMPTRSEERWNKDGTAVKEGLEKLGYTVDLQFSDDDIPTQSRQIDDMITKGVKVLVIASIDGSALSNQLENAKAANIPVISYDRLLMQSPNVDYYVSFDNYKVGGQMGDILINGLQLAQATADNPVIIELFAGSPDDNNSIGFYQGAMDKLKPFFDAGALKVPSGQIDRAVVGTLRWDAAEAQKRMENLLSAYYSGNEVLNGILSPYDPISLACLEAAKAVGYGSTPDKPLPVVGGQDCIVASCKSILAGEQYATVLKDTRSLGAATVTLVDDIMQGKEITGLDTTSYNNGVKVVPSLLLDSVIVTKDNLMSAVVDTGYHTAAELGL